MFDYFLSPFIDYMFLQRALLGCLLLALGAIPYGVLLVLRRMSLTGDAIAHAILPGAALGYLIAGMSLFAMTIGGLIAGLLIAILAGSVTRFTHLKEDANLAAFYLISLAAGVILVSARGNNIDLMHLLFGSLLALDNETLIFIGIITSISTIILSIFYRAFVAEAFDPLFLRKQGKISLICHLVFLAICVCNLVGGFHALGTLMAVGIMILPAVSANFWCRQLPGIMLTAIAIGFISSYLGLLFSFHYNLPAGASIILITGIIYLFSILFRQTRQNPGKKI
jgi:zinc/manganese transport system permease protein